MWVILNHSSFSLEYFQATSGSNPNHNRALTTTSANSKLRQYSETLALVNPDASFASDISCYTCKLSLLVTV